jgi:hypothetical protein
LSVLTEIRKKAGTLSLKRDIAKLLRERRICNLQNAHHIGVIYYLDDTPTFDKVSAFVKDLQDDGKKVKAIGYVESKILTGQFLPRLSYDFLYPSGLSWNLKPAASQAKDFIETKFDILIDLGMDYTLPLLYLGGLSQAGFKVGLESPVRANYLDLMIKLPEKGTLEELMQQIKHYLKEINKENEN